MDIFPSCRVQMLSECEAGQLVRILRTGFNSNFALVCDVPDPERRGLVSFDEDKVVFDLYEDADTISVLAYDGSLIWELDQEGPFEPPCTNIFDVSGSLSVSSEGSFLNVTKANASPITMMHQLNIGKGRVEQYVERIQRTAIFGSWKLYIEDNDRPLETRTKVASFCVKVSS